METKADRKTESGLNSGNKTECPEGTVSILETKREHVERAGSVTSFISKTRNLLTDYDSVQHEVLIFYYYGRFNVIVIGFFIMVKIRDCFI
jgi:hypothetical protein